MNKKAILMVTMILGLLVVVPLVAAAPLIQNQNGDVLQKKDQTQNCDGICLQDEAQANDCNQTCTQDQQCLQSSDRDNTCIGAGTCDGTQTRQQCQEECVQAGNVNGQQHCGGNQQRLQQGNCQAP
ncbi:MAG: hypothetical protein ACFCUE_13590 [Candidatus Bathyarchaeia archaeon]